MNNILAPITSIRACGRVRLTAITIVLASTIVACSTPGDDASTDRMQYSADAAALRPVQQDGQWGYMDSTGAVVVSPRFNRAFRFSDGLALVESDSGFGFIRMDGSYAIGPRFEDAWHFVGGRALIQSDGRWQVIDSVGEVVDPEVDVAADPEFNLDSDHLVENTYQPRTLQLIHADGRYGFRSTDGDVVIGPRFENAWYFSDGLARAMVDSMWGYIDSSGDFVIEPRYDLAWDFQNGLALVKVDDRLGYIDRQGNFVWPPSD